MDLFGISLSSTDLWLLAAAATCLAWFVPHRLAVARENRNRFCAAADKLHGAFGPALAFLERARLHGSHHERPDASVFLRDAFVPHAAAVQAFRPFVGRIRRKDYDNAWRQYCETAHAGTVEAVFMAEAINQGDPWKALQDLIHAMPFSVSQKPNYAIENGRWPSARAAHR